ncbi:MAG: hypothetical protein AAGC68_06550 [Verrucomicrobiota bacterium]
MVSCKTLDGKKGKEEQDEAAGLEVGEMKVPVGSIHMIHPSGSFVLIRSSRFVRLEPGTKLTSFNSAGMESGSYLVSDARKGQFLTADISRGHPSVGDQVVMDYAARYPSAAGDQSLGEEVQILE